MTLDFAHLAMLWLDPLLSSLIAAVKQVQRKGNAPPIGRGVPPWNPILFVIAGRDRAIQVSCNTLDSRKREALGLRPSANDNRR